MADAENTDSIHILQNSLLSSQDVGVTSIEDGQTSDTVEFTACSAEVVVVSGEEVSVDLSKHGVVLDQRFSQRRAVSGNEDKLGLSVSDALKGGLGAQDGFTRSHDEGQFCVDVFLGGSI